MGCIEINEPIKHWEFDGAFVNQNLSILNLNKNVRAVNACAWWHVLVSDVIEMDEASITFLIVNASNSIMLGVCTEEDHKANK